MARSQKTSTPSFKKGDLVKPNWKWGQPTAWRDATAAEARRDLEEKLKVSPWDSAGESHLPMKTTYKRIEKDQVCTVIKARVSARQGWSKVPKCCLVLVDGELLWMRRSDLELVG
jgi:hypothetical protein